VATRAGAASPAVAAAAPAARWREGLTTATYRLAAGAARAVPEGVALAAARGGAAAAAGLLGRRGRVARRHQARVRGRPLTPAEQRRALRAAAASYARYWAESLRLPATPPHVVDARFTIEGLERITGALAGGGPAPILALPHLGGWDVGGSWLVRQGIPLTVVVEPLRPPALFAWFAGLRRAAGLEVVALGPGAGREVLAALAGGRPVALLADRDLDGRGVAVEFFGEVTTLPAGPATLALRSGAPLLPTAVYFAGRGHHAVVRPPLDTSRRGSVRDDVARITQALAVELEGLVATAPEQWHLFQPLWPSDRAEPGPSPP